MDLIFKIFECRDDEDGYDYTKLSSDPPDLFTGAHLNSSYLISENHNCKGMSLQLNKKLLI